jgi:hypothetical protein
MALFSLSYDLVKRKDYPKLWEELERLNAKKVLFSQWVMDLSDDLTALQVRLHFEKFVDADDRLVVIRFRAADYASYNALAKIGSE